MKKIKAFTLLEIIIVITIIGMVATSLMRSRRNIAANVDTGRDAVNIIYKEMDQYIKDFQRNKIWEDSSGNIHEIDYFRLIFSGGNNVLTGTQLTVGNYYSGDDYLYFNSGTFINNQKYVAFQYLKGVEKYTYYTRNQSGVAINPIRISNNGKAYTGTTDNPNENAIDDPEYQFVICGGEGGKIEHIGAITINAVTKESRLDWCESEKYGGIDCSIFEDC